MPSLNFYWLIVGCEASFWVVLFAGLVVRYLWRRETWSRILLRTLPGIDLVLLAFTALDLKAGRPAGFAHGLAAAYVGFTVAFGSMTVAWADRHFAHRFTGAPAPAKAPRFGWPALRYELILWGRCLLAVAVTLVLIVGLMAFVNDAAATEALRGWFGISLGCAAFWFLFGPLWTLLFSAWRREPDA